MTTQLCVNNDTLYSMYKYTTDRHMEDGYDINGVWKRMVGELNAYIDIIREKCPKFMNRYKDIHNCMEHGKIYKFKKIQKLANISSKKKTKKTLKFMSRLMIVSKVDKKRYKLICKCNNSLID